MTPQTVLPFTYIEFDENWIRGGTVQYFAQSDAGVIVVAESVAGAKTTYWFQVSRGETVMVSYSTNIVYIPARCTKRARGDKTAGD